MSKRWQAGRCAEREFPVALLSAVCRREAQRQAGQQAGKEAGRYAQREWKGEAGDPGAGECGSTEEVSGRQEVARESPRAGTQGEVPNAGRFPGE